MKPLYPVEAITFDIGGTLIEPCPSVGEVYARVAAEFGWKELDAASIDRRFHEAWSQNRDFNYTEEAWSKLVARSFDGVIPPKACEEIFPTLYQRFGERACWRVHSDVFPALDELAARGFRLGVISNWDRRLRPLLDRLKLASFFETYSISCDIGFTKPSPVIFEHTLAKLGLPPSKVLHVGDEFHEDVRGAFSAGLNAVHLDRSQPSGDGRISSLMELRGLVGSLL